MVDSTAKGVRSPWGWAALVAAALGVAHLGLGLLLTRPARDAVAQLEEEWGRDALLAAPDPGAAPEASSPAYGAWSRARRLFDAAGSRGERRSQYRALTWGLAGSFVVQAGLVALAARRASGRAAGRSPGQRRPR